MKKVEIREKDDISGMSEKAEGPPFEPLAPGPQVDWGPLGKQREKEKGMK